MTFLKTTLGEKKYKKHNSRAPYAPQNEKKKKKVEKKALDL